MAGKAVILSRTAGMPLELTDLAVEPLCPVELFDTTFDEFFNLISNQDDRYAKITEKAIMQNRVLRYTAKITKKESG